MLILKGCINVPINFHVKDIASGFDPKNMVELVIPIGIVKFLFKPEFVF